MGMVHRSGSFELTRACRIRAQISRALLASALLAGAFALAGCYGNDGYELPTRAMKELSPEMLALLQKKNMPQDSPILVRIFKEESELEVWKQDTTGRYALLKIYPICRWSGDLGPKVKEGDRQAPEGFYQITPGLMNPNSNYYLAINTGFPNAFDKANGRTGAFLMIHGDCSSRGCYAMTDQEIGEIYALARDAFLGGEKSFQIQAYPFRMTPANLARHRNDPNLAFWEMIKEGNDHFEVSHLEPKVDVCDRRYVFDAVPPENSRRPLVFHPTGRCPAYRIDPEIAGAITAKERKDNHEYAQLVKEDVPIAPLVTGTDGGMNRVFIAKLGNPTYTYDDNGHVHVPPVQPGRLPPAISPPRGSESDMTAAVAEPPAKAGNTLTGLVDGLFASSGAAEPARVAAADTDSHTSFLGRLFGSSHKTAGSPGSQATGAVAASNLKRSTHNARTALARLRRKPAERHKSEPQLSEAPSRVVKRQQEVNAATPLANDGGLINGAQPVMPAGSFDSRWSGLQVMSNR
jgi:murein L,D-transpeptidase YafK